MLVGVLFASVVPSTLAHDGHDDARIWSGDKNPFVPINVEVVLADGQSVTSMSSNSATIEDLEFRTINNPKELTYNDQVFDLHAGDVVSINHFVGRISVSIGNGGGNIKLDGHAHSMSIKTSQPEVFVQAKGTIMTEPATRTILVELLINTGSQVISTHRHVTPPVFPPVPILTVFDISKAQNNLGQVGTFKLELSSQKNGNFQGAAGTFMSLTNPDPILVNQWMPFGIPFDYLCIQAPEQPTICS